MRRNKSYLIISALTLFALSSTVGAQEAKGDAVAGEKKIAMCIGCHGISGYQASFPEVYKVPMISGQNSGYLISALNAYKSGERKHPTMRSVAQGMTDQDIADVVAYYSGNGKVVLHKGGHGQAPVALSQQPAAPSPRVAELLNKGACVSCHGANFSKPIDPSYPKIAGQHRDYLFVALKAYKTEGTPAWGRNHAVMSSIAKQFSNAELKELANYLGRQSGEMQVVADSKFR